MCRVIKANTSIQNTSSVTKTAYDSDNTEMQRGYREGKKLYQEHKDLMEALKNK